MVDVPHEGPMRRPDTADSPIWTIALLGALVVLVVVGMVLNKPGADARLVEWQRVLGVIATLGVFTILYKENPLFRFVEHIFIGLATGYGVAYIWVAFIQPRWFVPMLPSSVMKDGQGQWWLIFALLLGLLFFSVYFPRLAWMNRFAFGVLMGWSAGAALQMFIGLIGPQIVTSFKAPVTTYNLGDAAVSINNFPAFGLWWHPFALVFVVVLVCVLSYFFFSVEHRTRWIRRPANAGRFLLMITLGAIFGTTVMGRLSLLIVRLEYLKGAFVDWWHLLVK